MKGPSPSPCSRRRPFLLVAFVLTLFALPVVQAQEVDISATWTDTNLLRVTFTPHPPAHLSDGFSVATPDGTLLDEANKPAPDMDGPFPAYSAPLAVDYSLPSGSSRPDSVLVTCQLCEDDMCYLPQTLSIPISAEALSAAPSPLPTSVPEATQTEDRFRIAASLDGHASPEEFLRFLSATPASLPSGGWRGFLSHPDLFLLAHGWALTVLAILLGGFLLNLTPCVLPMIPVNLAIIGATASSGTPRRTRFALGLAYGIGMATAYGGLGAAVVRAGGVFGVTLNASAGFMGGMAVVFAALGLAMFGTWNLDFSRWRRAGRMADRAKFPAAFVAGALSALLAGACVAPVLVAVLALAGGLYAAGHSGALLLPFLLGVGMAVPWPLAAAGFAVLPKPGMWMERIKKIFGVLILLLAAWYAWSAISLVRGANSPGHGAPPGFVLIDFDESDAASRLDTLLADAAETHRPVLLDFGARWCKVCALMEKTTLRSPQVTAALEGFRAVSIVANDPSAPSVALLLARYGVHGYPAYRLLLPE